MLCLCRQVLLFSVGGYSAKMRVLLSLVFVGKFFYLVQGGYSAKMRVLDIVLHVVGKFFYLV